ncbi:MAG: hypothetical protein ACXACU_17540 [Candidatus Hodarchaeales archaeon]|jgi:hypothetical protein
MEKMLTCQECDIRESIPHHCGKPMHIEIIDKKQVLVCWMGPSCGVQDLPTHHNKPMTIA